MYELWRWSYFQLKIYYYGLKSFEFDVWCCFRTGWMVQLFIFSSNAIMISSYHIYPYFVLDIVSDSLFYLVIIIAQKQKRWTFWPFCIFQDLLLDKKKYYPFCHFHTKWLKKKLMPPMIHTYCRNKWYLFLS